MLQTAATPSVRKADTLLPGKSSGRAADAAPKVTGRTQRRVLGSGGAIAAPHEQPLVAPQVAHLRQVPLRTSVKLPHSPQESPW